MSEQIRDPWNEYNRRYREKHPEKVQKWRNAAAINMLTRQGYQVTAPTTQAAEAAPVKEGERDE